MKLSPFQVIVLCISFLSFLLLAPIAQAETPQGFAITNQGVITKNRRPFFPFGFNHVSDVQIRYGDKLANDVQKMVDADFNVVQLVVTGPDEEKSTEKARLIAQQNGMYIIASYFKPKYNLWIDRLKNDPTILAWNTLDDFNVPYNNPSKNPTQAKAISDQLTNYATSVGTSILTFGSGGGYPYKAGQSADYLFGEYKDAMDIFAVQTYPIGNNDDSFANAPLEENIAYIKYSQDQLPENRPLIANLQSFAWPGERYPNAVETRNMVWAAIVRRAEGILGYAYWEESGDLSAKTALWQEWKDLRRDINDEFTNAVLNGRYTYFDTTPTTFGKPRIHASFFDENGKVYAVIINTNSQAELTTTNQLKIPVTANLASFKPLFPSDDRYGKTLTVVQNGDTAYLNGKVAASGVQVYVFERPESQTTNPQTPASPGSTSCRSDFNNDRQIDLADFTIFSANFFKSSHIAKTDINTDGSVDINDYVLFVADFFTTCS